MVMAVFPVSLVLGFFLIGGEALTTIERLACGKSQPYILTAMSGTIYSPGYLDGEKYPNNLDCSYAFLHRNKYQVIEFTVNDLEMETKDQCEGDHVHITVNQMSAKMICGGKTPIKFTTPPAPVQLLFKSDFQNNFRGFNISYKITNNFDLENFPCQNGYRLCLTDPNQKCVRVSSFCDGIIDCEDGSDERNCRRTTSPKQTCGQPFLQPDLTSDRVVGGQEARPGSWPWQADLQLAPVIPSGHVCGGTLINDQWVLAAAHCFNQARQNLFWRIRLGSHDKYLKDSTEQIRGIEKKFIYGKRENEFLATGEFNQTTDIALIKLFAPLDITNSVQPACLPPAGHQFKPGTRCYATGWGETRGTGSNRFLKQATLEIQKMDKCNNIYVGVNNATMLCAGHMDGFNGVCHGDSGGPLVCQENNKWYLAGVSGFVTDTNFISGICGVPNSPSGFGRVAYYVDWINNIIKSN